MAECPDTFGHVSHTRWGWPRLKVQPARSGGARNPNHSLALATGVRLLWKTPNGWASFHPGLTGREKGFEFQGCGNVASHRVLMTKIKTKPDCHKGSSRTERDEAEACPADWTLQVINGAYHPNIIAIKQNSNSLASTHVMLKNELHGSLGFLVRRVLLFPVGVCNVQYGCGMGQKQKRNLAKRI